MSDDIILTGFGDEPDGKVIYLKPKDSDVPDETDEIIHSAKVEEATQEKSTLPDYPGKPGPKPKQIDYKMLKIMCQYMATIHECAAAQDMSIDTLNARLKDDGHENFRTYFTYHRSRGMMALRVAQFQKAIKDKDTSMQIHLGKVYLGQAAEPVKLDESLEHMDQDGGAEAEEFGEIMDAVFDVIEAKSSKG